MWVNMPCMDGNGKGNVSIGVWRFQQHVRGGHIWGGNSLNWNLFGHSECLFGIIHQFQTKAIKLVTSTRKIWYSQIRSLPRFFGGGPKKKHPKSKQPSKKRIGKIIPKKINQATLTVNQKSSTTKRQKTANPSTSHHEDLAWCLCDFSHCWIKTFATHIIADTTRPHVHLNKRPWRRFHLFEIGWKSARRKGFGVYHKDISSLEFHQ